MSWAQSACRAAFYNPRTTTSSLLGQALDIIKALIAKLFFSPLCSIVAWFEGLPSDYYYNYRLERLIMPYLNQIWTSMIPPSIRRSAERHFPSIPPSTAINICLITIALSVYTIATSSSSGRSSNRSSRSKYEDRSSFKEAQLKKRRKNPGDIFYPGGLVNMGNTCFLNSVIQAMVSLEYFVDYLEKRTETYYEDEQLVDANGEKQDLVVTDALLALVDLLNDGTRSGKSFRPQILLSSLAGSKGVRHLLGYQQQDAHELFQFLSSAITKEQEPNLPRKVLSLKDVDSLWKMDLTQQNKDSQEKTDQFLKQLEKSCIKVFTAGKTIWIPRDMSRGSIRNPLLGLLASRITCQLCGYSSPWRHETFDNLSLTVPQRSSCSIQDLFQNYTHPEQIHGYICDKCTLIATVKKGQSDLLDLMTKRSRIKSKLDFLQKDSSGDGEHTSLPVNHDHPVVADNTGLRKRNDLKQKQEPSPIQTVSPKGKSQKEEIQRMTLLLSSKLEEIDATIANTTQELERLKRAKADSIFEVTYNDLIPRVKAESPICTKQTQIAYMPKSLCLHMQRSVMTPTGYIMKNHSRVVFEETLDLNDIMGLKMPISLDKNVTQAWVASQKEDDDIQTPKTKMDSPPPLEESSTMSSIVSNHGSDGNDMKSKSEVNSFKPDNTIIEPTSKVSSVVQSQNQGSREPSPTMIQETAQRRPFIYNLKAVIIHYGSHESGHFVAYRKFKQPPIRLNVKSKKGTYQPSEPLPNGDDVNRTSNSQRNYRDLPAEEMWFRISDASVDVVRSFRDEVLRHASEFAYMLFYERCDESEM